MRPGEVVFVVVTVGVVVEEAVCSGGGSGRGGSSGSGGGGVIVGVVDRGTGSKPARLRSGSLQPGLSLIV
jgi:hypothetical protein